MPARGRPPMSREVARPVSAPRVRRLGDRRGALPVAMVTIAIVAYVVWRHRDFGHQVVAGFASLAPATLAGALALVVVQVLCQGSRFWVLLRGDRGLTRLLVLHAFSVGEVFNALMPVRVGDAVKVMMLRRVHSSAESGLSRIVGALLADKVIDVATLLALSVTALAIAGYGRLASERAAHDLRWLAAGVVIVVSLVVAIPFVVGRGPRAGRFASAWRFARGVRVGFAALREPRRTLYSAMFGIAGRLAEATVIHVLCAALGVSLGAAAIMLALALLNLGIAVPLSIANLGAYEAALAFGLTVWGVPIVSAIAIAIAHHLIELVGIATTAGLVTVVRRWRASRTELSVDLGSPRMNRDP